MKISDITVSNRHRKVLGDIKALANSMKSVGLLHPVVIDTDGKLIAGERRLKAAISLGWTDIAATVAKNIEDVTTALLAERDENTCREPFTPSEAAAMAESLEPMEKKAADTRKSTNNSERDNLSTSEKGRAADKVAEAVGMSRHTLEKAKAVVQAAKADPEHYADLPEKMDTTRKVDPVHKEMLERAAEFPIPDGPTPAQIARNSPGVRWVKNIHECWVILNSLRDLGGIEKLTRSWSEDERQNYVVELTQFRDAADEWIQILEKKCKTKKSA